ncbi:MAG TPA: N-formylglutamate amidohydrolase [Noviherbaspirillum sp.]|uniref:N-formylglutamate amidohydrolase n=1 Tax=Noviherbaspirillum sp. TaxID=1926288 RepID=UPI002B493442|nr:N-formylglutamate amidohydrolase [Noviherbaspirillum sp.]HJV86013.1 N-formylglutamate amidohydrolase [Noviherbaspirillum sp.]
MAPPASDFFFVTCEHGGNRIPSRYHDFFRGHEELLRTHRGYDLGAIRVAREMAKALSAPLLVSTISRLLIDLNRSPSHPQLYSEATRAAPEDIRREIFRRYYRPYRTKAETQIAQAVASGMRVIHISCHSFTPELNGEVRNADLGLLYDPSRREEAALCQRWRTALRSSAQALKIRLNYPYTGTADGFTVYLRRRFTGNEYLGIELEINQKHVRQSPAHWHRLRETVITALQDALVQAPEALAPSWRSSGHTAFRAAPTPSNRERNT